MTLGFGAEASLPQTQSAPAVSHDTTRLCQIVVTLWDCQIHADAVRALSWIFSMYFLLSDGGSPRLVRKTEVELAIKPLHPTLIGNTFVIQPFLTHCSRRSSYFSNFRGRKLNNEHFFALTDQMPISGRFVVNTISVGNMKLCFKSVATCQSVQPSSNDPLRIFSRAIFEIFPSLTNWIALLLIIFRALLAVSRHVFWNLRKNLQDFVMSPSIAS